MKRMLAALFAMVLLFGACSSDKDKDETKTTDNAEDTSDNTDEPTDDTAGGGDLTLDEWIAAADQICGVYDPEFDALGAPATAEEFAAWSPDALVIANAQHEEIEALGIPDEGVDEVEEATDLLGTLSDLIEQIGVAGEAGDDAEIQSLAEQAGETSGRLDEIAVELGMEVCGNDDATSEYSVDAEGAAGIVSLDDIATFLVDEEQLTQSQAECVITALVEVYGEDELIALAQSDSGPPPEYADTLLACAEE